MLARSCEVLLSRFPLALRAAVLPAILVLPAASQADPPCGGWDIVSTPNVGNYVTRLTGVTSLSPNDAWSVGYWRNQPQGWGPVALHWDGSSWSVVNVPSLGYAFEEVAGVDAAPNGDVWVVGDVTGGASFNLPLVLRWRNGAWDYVGTVTLRPQTVYPYGARGGLAYDVAAIAADDVWAVGQAGGFGGGATSVPMALHWDGSTWTDVAVPEVASRHHELLDVAAISTDDVWAVGNYRFWAQAYHAVTFHWDGNAWSYVPSPIELIADSGLLDVVATGPNDVWALGTDPSGPLMMHWDGTAWSMVPAPPNTGGSMAAVAPNDIWVSGWDGFWHWDGSTWTELPVQVPGASYVIRSGGMDLDRSSSTSLRRHWSSCPCTTSEARGSATSMARRSSRATSPSPGTAARLQAQPCRAGSTS